MNRQIKFRCWDKKESKWLFGYEYPNLGGFTLFGEVVLTGQLNTISLDRLNDIETMQFTGEKDVNGKEIWEGDIVKRMADKYDFDKPDGEDRWKEVEISQIEYRGNGFWVKDEDFGWEGENLWDWKQMEVIGNVFETPELLKSDGK